MKKSNLNFVPVSNLASAICFNVGKSSNPEFVNLVK